MHGYYRRLNRRESQPTKMMHQSPYGTCKKMMSNKIWVPVVQLEQTIESLVVASGRSHAKGFRNACARVEYKEGRSAAVCSERAGAEPFLTRRGGD